MGNPTAGRLDRLRGAMAAAGGDAFVSLSPPANEYLSGFRGSTSAVLVTADTAALLCDFRYIEQAGAQAAGWEVSEVEGALEARAGEWLAGAGCRTALFEPARLTVAQHDSLRAASGSAALTAAPGLVDRLRETKDAGEIAKMREATRVAEEALETVLAGLRPGVTERETAARLEHEFMLRGAQKASFDTIVLFGARSSLPHGVPGPKPLEKGDIVLVDCGCVVDSYCSDLTRTAVFGNIPGSWFEEIHACVHAAQAAALRAVRAGVPAAEVDAAARDIIVRAGYGDRFGHGTGHGVGLEIHESPRLNKTSPAVLGAGMAVTVEPGIYLPGQGGVRIEDLVVVTEDGCGVLNRLPKELQVIQA